MKYNNDYENSINFDDKMNSSDEEFLDDNDYKNSINFYRNVNCQEEEEQDQEEEFNMDLEYDQVFPPSTISINDEEKEETPIELKQEKIKTKIKLNYQTFLSKCHRFYFDTNGECLHYSIIDGIIYEKSKKTFGKTIKRFDLLIKYFGEDTGQKIYDYLNGLRKKMKFIHINNIYSVISDIIDHFITQFNIYINIFLLKDENNYLYEYKETKNRISKIAILFIKPFYLWSRHNSLGSSAFRK